MTRSATFTPSAKEEIEIDKKFHILQSKISPDQKRIELDITVENYDIVLQETLQKQLEKYQLTDAKLKIYQTIQAGETNQNQFDNLKEEIRLLRQVVEKR